MGWDKKLQCPTLGGGLFAFIKGSLHPWNPNGNTNFEGVICHDYDGLFQVLVLSVFVFKRLKHNASAPIIANCPTCKTYFIS